MITAKEIHDDFYAEVDLLCAPVDEFTQSEPVLTDAQLVLQEIGFTNIPDFRTYIQQDQAYRTGLQEHTKKLETNAMANLYRVKYPTYKFITHDAAMKVANKYSLIMKAPDLYIGDIPVKNQQEIAAFWTNVQPDPEDLQDLFICGTYHIIAPARDFKPSAGEVALYRAQGYTGNMTDIHRQIVSGNAPRPRPHMRLQEESFADVVLPNIASYLHHPQTQISSDMFRSASMGMSSSRQADGTYVGRDRETGQMTNYATYNEWLVKDPIVLYRIKGGYLIVSAWGEEASDPDVFNEQLN